DQPCRLGRGDLLDPDGRSRRAAPRFHPIERPLCRQSRRVGKKRRRNYGSLSTRGASTAHAPNCLPVEVRSVAGGSSQFPILLIPGNAKTLLGLREASVNSASPASLPARQTESSLSALIWHSCPSTPATKSASRCVFFDIPFTVRKVKAGLASSASMDL